VKKLHSELVTLQFSKRKQCFNYAAVQTTVCWHEHSPSASAATDQWPFQQCSASTQPRQRSL